MKTENSVDNIHIRACEMNMFGDRFAGIVGTNHVFFASPDMGGWLKIAPGDVEHVAISSDDTVVAAAGSNWVSIWDAELGTSLEQLESGRLRQLAVSANGDIVAMLSEDGVVTTKARWKSTTDKPYAIGPIQSIAFSRIASVLAIAEESGQIGMIDYRRRYYWNSGIIGLGQDEEIVAMAFDRGSEELVAITSEGNRRSLHALMIHASIPDAGTENKNSNDDLFLHASLKGGVNRVTSVAFTHDGAELESGSDDGAVRIFDVAAKELRHVDHSHESYVRDVTFSHDESSLMSVGEDGTDRLFEWPSMDQTSVVTSAHSNDAVVGTREGLSIRVATDTDEGPALFCGQELGQVEWPIQITATGNVIAVDRSAWGHVFDQQGAQLLRFQVGSFGNTSLAFSPDNSVLASAANDGRIHEWDLETTGLIRRWQAHEIPVSTIEYSPDGKLLASADGRGELRIWNLDTGEMEFSQDAHFGNIRDIEFSSDG